MAGDIETEAPNQITTINGKSQSSNGVGVPNGSVGEKITHLNGDSPENVKATDKLAVWNSISKWLPPRNRDDDAWWKLTGPQLAVLLASADYNISTQYETLLFHWRHVIPVLGPAPFADTKGKSPTCMDGTAIEFSWRWSVDNKPPEVRTAFEPFSRAAGSLRDPLGIKSGMDLFHDLEPYNTDVDLDLIYELINKMFESPLQIYAQTNNSAPISNHIGMGLEFGQGDFLPKTYFRPRKTLGKDKTGPLSLDDWEKIVTDVFGKKPVVDNAFDFVRNKQSKFGLNLAPLYIGTDITKARNGRMKLYFLEKKTSFNSMCAVFTMGGTIDIPQSALDGMWELIRGICGLPDDYPKDEELPKALKDADEAAQAESWAKYKFWPYLGYYFEMGPGRDVPDIKLYIPTTYYGVNDQVVADTTVKWAEKNGRGKYVPAFWESLRTIAPHRRLDEDIGVMLWLALMVKKGSLQVTTYLSPEGYHPNRFAKTQP